MGIIDRLKGTKKPREGVPPKSQEEVRAALLGLNRSDAPFVVRDGSPENVDLVSEWRILDPEWYNYFNAVGMKRTFQIHMRFDSQKNELRSVDKEWLVEWAAGVPRITPSEKYGRGQIDQSEVRFSFQRDETGKLRKVNEGSFTTKDLKNPIQDTVTEMGWTWRGVSLGKL